MIFIMKKNYSTDETKTVKAAENTHSNEGTTNNQNQDVNQNNRAVDVTKPAKKRYHCAPLAIVLRDARTTFHRQLKKDGKVKRASLSSSLSKHSALYPDKLRFELDFKAERDRLLDSRRFRNDCERLQKNPEYMADNILFEGKSFVDKVLKDGIEYVIRENLNMFNCPLWEDTEKLYSKEESNE